MKWISFSTVVTLLAAEVVLACGDTGPTDTTPPLELPLANKIVFASSRADTLGDIFVMDLDGSNIRKMTDATTRDACPSLSPDGNWIAYFQKYVADTALRYDLRPDSFIVMKADGTAPKAVAALWYPYNQCPIWSSDSRRVAVAERTYSMIKNPTDYQIRTFSIDGQLLGGFTTYSFASLSLSPDGSRLVGAKGGYPDGPATVKPLTINIDGTDARSPGPGFYPSWAPHGNEIAYLCSGLCLAADDGSAPRKIVSTQEDGWFGSPPAFSPDGSTVAFVCGADLCVVDLGAGTITRLTMTVSGWDFSWTSDNQRLVFTCQSPTNYFLDICIIQKDGTGLTNLTNDAANDDSPSLSRNSQ